MTALARRSLLLGSVAGGAMGVLGCAAQTETVTTVPATGETSRPHGGTPRVLLVFFSRAGENYDRGGRIDLEVGNTAVLAGLLADRTGCDVHEITAVDPYPDSYEATVQRNTEEQDADARPGIVGYLPDPRGHDVVLLASPIWNVRPPMIMSTLTDALDLTGKTVHPVVTHAVSGLGDAAQVYAAACPGAMLGEGLAVQGEEVADSGPQVDRWLAAVGLTSS